MTSLHFISEPLDPGAEPICTLDYKTALTRTVPSHLLLADALEERTLPDGIEYLFPSSQEIWQRVHTYIEEERECCRFLAFEAEQAGENIRLTVVDPGRALAEGIEMRDLRGYKPESDVLELLALANHPVHPDPASARVAQTLAEYRSNSTLHLWGATAGSRLIGIVGFRTTVENRIHLLDVAVRTGYRRRGVGRHLLAWLRTTQAPVSIHGITWEGATGFYEACGFVVWPNGTFEDGHEAYRLYWPPESRTL